jgi:membrane protease YdiL (CAAX protease family)
MQERRQGNSEIEEPTLFEALNQYYLLFFAFSCILASVFLQEIFVSVRLLRLGIVVAPLVGIVLPVAIITRRFRGGFRSQLRIHKPRLATTTLVFAATLTMVVVVDHVYIISQQFMPAPDSYIDGLKALKPTGIWSAIATFVGLCVVVPFSEEVVFRGLIQRVFSVNMNGIVALLIAGVFSGVIHLSPQLLLSMTCFGIFLGFVFFATGNLTYTIFSHAVLNTVAFIQLTLASVEEMSTTPFYVQDWWYLPVAVVIVLVFLREIKRGATRSAPPFE